MTRLAGIPSGEGEGPGEFQRVDGASFGFTAKGELFFTEFINGHRWITLFDRSGKLKEVISPRMEKIFGVNCAESLGNGKFLVQFQFNSEPRPEKEYFLYESPYSIVLMSALGKIERELVNVSITDMISFSSNGGAIGLPFTPYLSWAKLGETELVWTDGLSPILQVIDLNGHLTREISTPLPFPQKVTAKDLQEWKSRREAFLLERNPSWYNRYGRVIQEYSSPLYGKPIIGNLEYTPGGNLFFVGSAGPDNFSYVFWLLDVQGNELISVDVDVWGVHFSQNYLFWISEDQEETLQIHALRHNGDEQAGLEKMLEIEMTGQGH